VPTRLGGKKAIKQQIKAAKWVGAAVLPDEVNKLLKRNDITLNRFGIPESFGF
jgi:hypothetical protein